MTIAVLTGIFFALPLWWILISAFRPELDIFRYLDPLSAQSLIPFRLTLDNLTALFAGTFLRATFNSIFVAAATVIIGLVISVLAAYALSVLEFRGRGLIFLIVVVGFLVPFDAVAIPLGEIFTDLSLRNTYAALILPGIGNGLAIFVLRQFFIGIPKDLKEAASLDGAGTWRILWQIYVVNSKPALVGAGLILFVFQWQAYLWPLIVISDDSMQVAPVLLAKLQGQAEYGFDPGQIFAGTLILSIVPIFLLLRFQKNFVQSVATSGLD
ncbi:MAG: carbohydrate ABC transporter permease [Homoserinimonas sp.]